MRGNNVSFSELLGLLFIGLKMTGQIDWSWWAVLSPLFILMVALVWLQWLDE